MPVEVKPLFRPEVLGPKVRGFVLPAGVAARVEVVRRWAELLSSADADRFKEQELLPDFLGDVFGKLLGYTGPAENPERYTLSRERHVEVGGKFADAVLGVFGTGAAQYVVAVEGKGPTDPLDRPFKSRSLSAVDQGYRYAINLPCDWIVVTSMRQTRLYYKGADQQTYERFLIGELAENFIPPTAE